ncbi:multidrug resistance protein 2, putative, partial [Hepatocystis sp. ex Piliocolobus tephrosceles]
MNISSYEYLRYLGIQNEIKRRKIKRKIIIYHITDMLISLFLFCACFKFDIVISYKFEKSIFYSFNKSMIDVIFLNKLKILCSSCLLLFYSKISKLPTLKTAYAVIRHFSGIFCIIYCIKAINFCYDVNVDPFINNGLYINISRGVYIFYNVLSSIYYFIIQYTIYSNKKRCLVAKNELERMLLKEIHAKKYKLFNNKINNNFLETDESSSINITCNDETFQNILDTSLLADDLNDAKKKKKNQNKKPVKKWHKKINSSLSNVLLEKNLKESSLKTKQNINYISVGGEDAKLCAETLHYLENKLTYSELKKILLPYLWPSERVDLKGNCLILRIYMVMIFLFIILSKIFNVISPIYLGKTSNEVLNKNKKDAIYFLALYVIFFFASRFLKEICGILYSQIQQSAFIELQESIFQTIHTLSYEWYSTKNSGGIMRIIDRGTESANNLMNSLLMYIIPASIEGVITCIIFVVKYQNSLLGTVLFIGLTSYIYATIKITQWRKKIRSKANKMDNVYHDIAHDSLTNYENVKYFSNEPFEIKKFCNALSNYNRYNLKILNSLGILNSIQQFILNFTLFFTLLIAIYMIVDDGADSGTFISVVVYTSNVFAPLNILGTLYTNIVKSFTDISDLTEILREKVDMADDEGLEQFSLTSHERKFGVSIQFSDVNFRYPSQPMHLCLKNVNLYIQPGTTCGLVGHTGSGKTTISKLLYRFYDAEGEIKIAGKNITHYTRNSVRNIIGIVPQDTILFNETIKYNILYGNLNATDEQLVQAVKLAQLHDFIERLPKKWDTIVGDKGVKLSGGERQRIAIARCLLKDPKIVIFDEATSSLDSKTEYLFQKAVEDLKKNRTLIIIAHRLSTIVSAELIVLLNKGRIVESGTHDYLLKLNKEYAEMWNMQSGSNDIYTEDGFSSTYENRSSVEGPTNDNVNDDSTNVTSLNINHVSDILQPGVVKYNINNSIVNNVSYNQAGNKGNSNGNRSYSAIVTQQDNNNTLPYTDNNSTNQNINTRSSDNTNTTYMDNSDTHNKQMGNDNSARNDVKGGESSSIHFNNDSANNSGNGSSNNSGNGSSNNSGMNSSNNSGMNSSNNSGMNSSNNSGNNSSNNSGNNSSNNSGMNSSNNSG